MRRILKGVEKLRPVSSYNSRTPKLEDVNKGLTTAGDVKPAAPKSESDDSSQSDDGDDDVKAIIIEDSSESDPDGDAAANGCEYHSYTFVTKS